jgi:hypothetical protein
MAAVPQASCTLTKTGRFAAAPANPGSALGALSHRSPVQPCELESSQLVENKGQGAVQPGTLLQAARHRFRVRFQLASRGASR